MHLQFVLIRYHPLKKMEQEVGRYTGRETSGWYLYHLKVLNGDIIMRQTIKCRRKEEEPVNGNETNWLLAFMQICTDIAPL